MLHALLEGGGFDHIKEGEQVFVESQAAKGAVNHLHIDVEVVVAGPFGFLILFVPGPLQACGFSAGSGCGGKFVELVGVKFVPPAVGGGDGTGFGKEFVPPLGGFADGFSFVGVVAVVVGENPVAVRRFHRPDGEIRVRRHGDAPAVGEEFVKLVSPVEVESTHLGEVRCGLQHHACNQLGGVVNVENVLLEDDTEFHFAAVGKKNGKFA